MGQLRRICELLKGQISDVTPSPGARVPPTRALASRAGRVAHDGHRGLRAALGRRFSRHLGRSRGQGGGPAVDSKGRHRTAQRPARAFVVGLRPPLHGYLGRARGLWPRDEDAVAAVARERGVGLSLISPLFATPAPRLPPRPAGFIPGYAGLTVEQVRQGMRILAEA